MKKIICLVLTLCMGVLLHAQDSTIDTEADKAQIKKIKKSIKQADKKERKIKKANKKIKKKDNLVSDINLSLIHI